MTRYSLPILLFGALFGCVACDGPQDTSPKLSTQTGALEEEAVVQRVTRTDFVPVAEQTRQPEPAALPARQETTYDQAGLLRLAQQDPRLAAIIGSMRRSEVDPNTRPRHHVYHEGEGCTQSRLGDTSDAVLTDSPSLLENRVSGDRRSDVPHEERLSHLPSHDLDASEPSEPDAPSPGQ